MKTSKKLLATATALTLALSPMTAFAEDATSPTTQDSPNDITGGVTYVDTTIYKVTLPTTTGLSFAIDPQGLIASLGEDGNGTYDDSKAGTIVGTGNLQAVNQSSVDIDLTSKFYVTDSTGTLTLLDEKGTIDDTKQQLQLKIATKYVDKGTAASAPADIDGYDGDDSLYVTATSNSDTSDLVVKMGAADYEFTGNKTAGYQYTQKTDNNNSTNLFMAITGKVAKDYDWSAYTKADSPATIKLSAVFGFDAAATTPATPTYSKASGATITLTDGKQAVTGVRWGTQDAMTNSISTSQFSYDASTQALHLPRGLFAAAANGETRYFQITYGDRTTKTIAVIIAD